MMAPGTRNFLPATPPLLPRSRWHPSARQAEGLKPLRGQVIDLGDVSGVAYYTVERDGFRVVATLAKKDEDAVPVRVVAVLAPGQSLALSTPHEAGTPPDAVDFIRRADTVLVHKAAAAVTSANN
jgi:hypothetical protein